MRITPIKKTPGNAYPLSGYSFPRGGAAETVHHVQTTINVKPLIRLDKTVGNKFSAWTVPRTWAKSPAYSF
jgi:hypothetical protein